MRAVLRWGFVCLAVFGVLIAGCSRPDIPEPRGLSEETSRVYVYFATGRSLVEESRVVDATRVYEATLDELLAASPEINPGIAIVQPTAEVNGVALEAGVLTIDWSPEVLLFEAEPGEKVIALAAFLRTFGQFPEVEQVRFTVEGQTEGEIDGRDVRAFWQDVSLIDQPWDVIRPEDPSQEATSTETTSAG